VRHAFGVECRTSGKDVHDVAAVLGPPRNELVDDQVLSRRVPVLVPAVQNLTLEIGLGHVHVEVHAIRRRALEQVR